MACSFEDRHLRTSWPHILNSELRISYQRTIYRDESRDGKSTQNNKLNSLANEGEQATTSSFLLFHRQRMRIKYVDSLLVNWKKFSAQYICFNCYTAILFKQSWLFLANLFKVDRLTYWWTCVCIWKIMLFYNPYIWASISSIIAIIIIYINSSFRHHFGSSGSPFLSRSSLFTMGGVLADFSRYWRIPNLWCRCLWRSVNRIGSSSLKALSFRAK